MMLTDEWYPTLTKPNVELVTERIAEVTPAASATRAGSSGRPTCSSSRPASSRTASSRRWRSIGREGRTLAEEWGEAARAYLGLSVPGFPNMFLLYGPNTNGGTGSVIYTLEAGMGHVIAALRELDRADAGRIEVRREAAERFDGELRAALRRHRLAQRLHELVRRRERQRPQPVALAVERVPPPHRDSSSPAPTASVRVRARVRAAMTDSSAITPENVRAFLGDSFPGHLGIEPLEIEDGHARGRIVVDKRHLHPGGYVHGGAWTALGDTVAAWATFRNIPPGHDFTTIELKLNVFSAGLARRRDRRRRDAASRRPQHGRDRGEDRAAARAAGSRAWRPT